MLQCEQCAQKNEIPPDRLADVHRCNKCQSRLGHFERPVELSQADLDGVVAKANIPVIVDVRPAWCEHSAAMAQQVEQLAHRQAGLILVCSVDPDTHPEVAKKYDIREVPTFLRFDGGWLSRRFKGAWPVARLEAELL